MSKYPKVDADPRNKMSLEELSARTAQTILTLGGMGYEESALDVGFYAVKLEEALASALTENERLVAEVVELEQQLVELGVALAEGVVR